MVTFGENRHGIAAFLLDQGRSFVTHHLLLVEDHPCVRTAFSRLLSVLNIQIFAYESVEAAEAALDFSDINIALLDCRLPGRLGTDFAAELAAAFPRLPIILMSAEDGFQDVGRRQCPSALFLRKPIPPDRLIQAIAKRTCLPIA